MALNISEYPISKSIAMPVQSFQNSNVYQSSINYETTENYITNTGLSQSINLLNNDEKTNYYNQPITNYQTEQINSTYTTPITSQMKILPTKYLPVKVISDNQQLNDTNYAQVIPVSSYNTTQNNLNIISESNNNLIENTNTYYNETTTTTSVPTTNISYTNEEYNINNINSIDNTNNYQTQEINQEYTTPVATTSDINYTAEEYQINDLNDYQTQIQNETENVNYEVIQNGENININNNDNNNYLVNELVEVNQNTVENQINIETNENQEYFINSDDNINNENIPQENFNRSYILQSPLVKKKFDIFSEIQSPLSNFETQSYNQENTIYKLQNEILNLKAENEIFKQKLGELDKYKSEAAEARALKEQIEQLSPLREQLAEMASLKAQLAELNELKMKVKELENLRGQLEQTNNKKKKKFKSLGKKTKKEIKKENIEEKNINNMKGNTNINLEEKNEQAFVNGDILHSIAELEMLVRKINKSSQKMTLNLIYKATADSDKAQEFHKKCDKAKSTLVLIETDKGKRFGGYTSTTWEGKSVDKLDENAFVFSLDKMKIYDNIKGENAIGCYPKFGPVFLGCQIRIYDNAFQRGGTTYEKGLNYNTKEDFELTGGDREFKVKDIEVYEIIAQ